MIHLKTLCLALTSCFGVAGGIHATEFETNASTLGIAEGVNEPTSADLTVDDITLTVASDQLKLDDSNKGKTVGISGNGTGQINADEKLVLTFDRDVVLNKITLSGVKENEDGSPETAVVTIEDLDLELTLSAETVEPEIENIEAKGAVRVIFKGRGFVLPAGAEIALTAGTEGSTFTLRSIDVEEVAGGDGNPGGSEPE